MQQEVYDVVIVGAGLAGLRAGQCARKQGLSALIVEASNRIGGRVKTLHNTFAGSIPVELGAELVHGSTNELKQLLDENHVPTEQVCTWAHGDGMDPDDPPVRGGYGYYYVGKREPTKKGAGEPDGVPPRLFRQDKGDLEFRKLTHVLDKLGADDAEDEQRGDDAKTSSSVSSSSSSSSSAASSSSSASPSSSASSSSSSATYPLVRDFLAQHGVSQRMLSMAHAGFANTLCSKLDTLPLEQTSELWSAFANDGHGEYRVLSGLDRLLFCLRAQGPPVWLDWPVKSIRLSTSGVGSDGKQQGLPGELVLVINARGEEVRARHVIVAAPPTMIDVSSDSDEGDTENKARTANANDSTDTTASVAHRRGDLGVISFYPSLPKEKTTALRKIVFEPALKCVIRFCRRFWPQDMHGMICADMPIPEFWAHISPPAQPSSSSSAPAPPSVSPSSAPPAASECKSAAEYDWRAHGEFILVGFACADYVRALALPEAERREVVLSQLDEMFGTQADPRPAHDAYLDMMFQDWGQEPFIRGGYSSPSPSMTAHGRRHISAPCWPASGTTAAKVAGFRLFFAGEHTHETRYMVMHAAIETGSRAIQQIMAQQQ